MTSVSHTVVSPLLPTDLIDRLRAPLAEAFTDTAVGGVLGLAGEAELARGDLTGVARRTGGGSPTETWIRLFLLGAAVPEPEAAAALAGVEVGAAIRAGLLERTADDQLRAALDIRPYREADGPQWWVVSDLAADVRAGPLSPDHVLGVGAAATTLAQAVLRRPVGSALDVGTGCGVQALHLSEHADSVTVTDVSARALRAAATTAALNGLRWQFRAGSLLEPVADRRFDLVVANPPFIVGPGFAVDDGGYHYRDSGIAGDGVSARLTRGLPERLNPDGVAQLLANWAIRSEQPWQERVADWLPSSGCDAWVWQREVADPSEYVAMWLRDAGERPGTPSWRARYDRWLDWFEEQSVLAVGMGLINLRRTDADHATVRCEDVGQAHAAPISPAIGEWFDRTARLAATRDDELLAQRLTLAPDAVLTTESLGSIDGWQPASRRLRQTGGMRWDVEVDESVASLVAACTGLAPLALGVDLLAASLGVAPDAARTAVAPVVRDLIERGFLLLEQPG